MDSGKVLWRGPAGPVTPAWWQTLQLVVNPIAFLETNAQRYGDAFTTRVLGAAAPPVVFFSDPTTIAAIFTEQAEKLTLGQVTHPFRPLTGDRSLIMLDGVAHQRQRQLLMPPLHGPQLRHYGALIQQIATDVSDRWQPGDTLRLLPDMTEIALTVILRVVFGLQPGPRYTELAQRLTDLLAAVTRPLYSSQFFFPSWQRDLGPWSPWGRFVRQRQQIDALLAAEIAERRTATEPGADVLSLLLTARDAEGNPLTDVELRDQLMTLLLLGHDTTAAALTWAFHWLHQEVVVQDKVRYELARLGPVPDPGAIAQLPYLNAVCQESLRLVPIALIAQPRTVREPVTIGDYEFPPGWVLVPCIYTAHRRSGNFAHPEQFDPTRFLQQKPSPYTFFPFGGGARSCIGGALSLYEMKLVLATILSRWQLQAIARGPVRPVRRGIIFVPSGNFRLRVQQRLAN